MGNYAAAFTVVFWGSAHALLLICLEKNETRARMLVVGLVLPLIALSATAFGLMPYSMDGEPFNSFSCPLLEGDGRWVTWHTGIARSRDCHLPRSSIRYRLIHG